MKELSAEEVLLLTTLSDRRDQNRSEKKFWGEIVNDKIFNCYLCDCQIDCFSDTSIVEHAREHIKNQTNLLSFI